MSMQIQDGWSKKALNLFEFYRKTAVEIFYDQAGKVEEDEAQEIAAFSYGELTMTLNTGKSVKLGETLIQEKMAVRRPNDDFLSTLFRSAYGNLERCQNNDGEWAVFDNADYIKVGDPIPSDFQDEPLVERAVERNIAARNLRLQEASDLEERNRQCEQWAENIEQSNQKHEPTSDDELLPPASYGVSQSSFGSGASGSSQLTASPSDQKLWRDPRARSVEKLRQQRSESSGFKKQLPFLGASGCRYSPNPIVVPAFRPSTSNVNAPTQPIPKTNDSETDKENGAVGPNEMADKLDDLNL